ncbi:uncharacterized protein VNE69_03196 [Vairimorpha necatrix]|uniref:DUF5097 domain-containing protein n=1 Tax=Vairimorpha necatrix TaxID=6039 RepID=A0AAX4JAU9_9MICR
MIKDYAIRYFIFKHFCKNIKKEIDEMAREIFFSLKDKFLLKEEVLVNLQEGLVVKIFKGKFYILTKKDFRIIKCDYNEITRKPKFNINEIVETLYSVTYESPFGVRLLRKNIYECCHEKKSIIKYLNFLKKKEDKSKKTDIELLNIHKEKATNDEAEELIDEKKKIYNIIEDEKRGDKIINEYLEDAEVQFLDITSFVPSSEIFKVESFEFNIVNAIITVYSHITNFYNNKILLNTSIIKLIKLYKEYAYDSEIIGIIHGILIDNLYEEKNNIGLSGIITVNKDLIDNINVNILSNEVIVGNEVGLRGWKLKTRSFFLDIYKITKNKKILSFYNALNKKSPFNPNETFVLRVFLTLFLIKCNMATKKFKANLINELKKLKELENSLLERNRNFNLEVRGDEDSHLIDELKRKIILSPMKQKIGTLNGGEFILVNLKIFYQKNDTFYIPSKSTIEEILKKYQPIDKIEFNTCNNLKNILECLYLRK